jgi:predicted O-methyltransferase YrrM
MPEDLDQLLMDLFVESLHNGPGDIRDHLNALALLAASCEHVTEFGTSVGISTSALMLARPKRLITYDITRNPRVSKLEEVARQAGIEFRFRQQSTRQLCELEPTDLLFIDTLHVQAQLTAELFWAPQVRRYIVMHDTVTFGTYPEHPAPDSGRGLLFALLPFLKENKAQWRLAAHYQHNNGLTVLERM